MKATLRNFLIFFGVLILLAAVWYFRNIVVYILVSGVLSIMGRPLVDLFCRIRIWKWKFPRVLAALFALIIIWGSILLFLYIFIPLVTKQINHFTGIDSEKIVRLIEGPLEKIEKLFVSLNPSISDTLSLKAYIASKVSEVLSIDMIQDFIGSIIGVLGNVVVAIFSISFITFFFLKDQHLFFESILMWIPDRYVDNVTRALNSIKKLLTRYFIGIVIQSTCIMILIDIGMTIIGIEFHQALVMGLIIGILNVIPYVGPWLGLFIAIIMGVASHINQDFNTVVIPLVYYMIIVEAVTHTIDNVVFQPVIFSSSVKAHPLEIFVVVLAAGFAAGVPGMILGIPTYTVLRVFAREFFYGFKAVQKITSSLSDENSPEKSRISNVLIEESKRLTTRKRSGKKSPGKAEE
ncbi:MAG: AI-2E family transporter [Bacteroidales bacterium]|nr:AI-2E family transporter [Bacteroidales bacterium]HPM17583.1 AI-2E family transporter [Bacteroidales bacterium]HQG77667.1 AI-2E family transporter [Bacteroidales bacterium]